MEARCALGDVAGRRRPPAPMRRARPGGVAPTGGVASQVRVVKHAMLLRAAAAGVVILPQSAWWWVPACASLDGLQAGGGGTPAHSGNCPCPQCFPLYLAHKFSPPTACAMRRWCRLAWPRRCCEHAPSQSWGWRPRLPAACAQSPACGVHGVAAPKGGLSDCLMLIPQVLKRLRQAAVSKDGPGIRSAQGIITTLPHHSLVGTSPVCTA